MDHLYSSSLEEEEEEEEEESCPRGPSPPSVLFSLLLVGRGFTHLKDKNYDKTRELCLATWKFSFCKGILVDIDIQTVPLFLDWHGNRPIFVGSDLNLTSHNYSLTNTNYRHKHFFPICP